MPNYVFLPYFAASALAYSWGDEYVPIPKEEQKSLSPPTDTSVTD